MKEYRTKKKNRYEGYNYSSAGSYFVTICIKDGHELLGTLVGATILGRQYVEMSNIGEVAEKAILHNNRGDVIIDCYVIMPNHIHMIITIRPETGDRGRPYKQSFGT